MQCEGSGEASKNEIEKRKEKKKVYGSGEWEKKKPCTAN